MQQLRISYTAPPTLQGQGAGASVSSTFSVACEEEGIVVELLVAEVTMLDGVEVDDGMTIREAVVKSS
jgi:hypothetical protein